MNELIKKQLDELMHDIARRNVGTDEWRWFEDQTIKLANCPEHIYLVFSQLTGKLQKKGLKLTDRDKEALQLMMPGFQMRTWDTHRLARVRLLLKLRGLEKSRYIVVLHRLFDYADVHELVALYGSLIFLEYPKHWRSVCAEGIRTNIGLIHEAIMYDNPYPFFYLDDGAWNQLILKAIFNNMKLDDIVGFYGRMNKSLISSLLDYVAERKAASRSISRTVLQLLDLREKIFT
ncbi:EboA domain-containing protein [Olivibacter sp. CPCC 100613]|uniref:EboA domain-containing protein n=1 Tax=Olivibacter sp. CPCC 100613 TaxID=3079931 RepID=UPI002FF5E1E5